MTAADGCGGHEGIGEDLRVLALAALERLDPVLDRLRAEPESDPPETCASCPICAVIAALRGERPELAVRLAEHATGLVAVLRAALEAGGPAPAAADVTERPPARRVQRIRVERRSS
ncbi:hypothetical protein FHX44_1114 [Pseudonocardia hierapolitana]|uniref:Uncharacterized protein n=1 Tax=Pseudonocardia hierapolitana TaxID=1128676 RepID=A0A561SGZ1_9PSEU|nr:hypothetical protein [Pseudonocardia hierapolitana]TWF74135.1 hypothetical protein FHX44_1114 [Pseudonocardia hierapolitana]